MYVNAVTLGATPAIVDMELEQGDDVLDREGKEPRRLSRLTTNCKILQTVWPAPSRCPESFVSLGV